MWQCSQHHENREEAKFCAKCGEKRVMEKRCPQCASLLEPDDAFCTSCGHRLGPDPEPIDLPAAVAPPAAVAMAPITPTAVPPPPEEAAKEPVDEPVTFSFGGAMIEMKEPGKPDRIKPKKRAGGMSSTVSAILSFAVIALVLWIAFYLITR